MNDTFEGTCDRCHRPADLMRYRNPPRVGAHIPMPDSDPKPELLCLVCVRKEAKRKAV